jgi:hypothetical protein
MKGIDTDILVLLLQKNYDFLTPRRQDATKFIDPFARFAALHEAICSDAKRLPFILINTSFLSSNRRNGEAENQ